MLFDSVISKPPYRVPSMDDVRAIEKTSGIVVASTFSGAGGTCLGWRMAGADVRYALEFVEEAQRTYRANSSAHLDPRDVRDVKGHEILAACGVDELDVFEGSPPCSSFSMSGKRSEGWGKEKAYSTGKHQRTDDLLFEWMRLLGEIRPRAFAMENVAGLTIGRALDEYLHVLIRQLSEFGYRVDARVLLASEYGVPQARPRLFIIGFRNDVGATPRWPTPLAYTYTLGDALAYAGHDPDDVDDDSAAFDCTKYSIGPRWEVLKVGEQDAKRFNLIRADPGKPCPTITATGSNPGAASVMHPHECRKFNVRELKSICSFPLDFAMTGTQNHRAERLGRAVPPLLARAIAKNIIEELNNAGRRSATHPARLDVQAR